MGKKLGVLGEHLRLVWLNEPLLRSSEMSCDDIRISEEASKSPSNVPTQNQQQLDESNHDPVSKNLST